MKIFNRDWEQIQAAQQGGTVDPILNATDDTMKLHESDLWLLEKYGVKKLKEFEYYGVLDRLEKAGIITKETK